ncbi:ribose-5-phosphate isomerase RpiA [Rubrivirga sp. IMCC45206]|uniref:ribose-5-phosphate isomerase RpiA n=1 Tax=Rubrivirga sp. IMCC45206 TaxID=3391614 RepID=UPI00398F8F51
MSQSDAKRAAGTAAAALVESGMTLGLGTGSTTAFAIEAIGARVASGEIDVVGVPTSFAAERLARRHGVPVATLDALGIADAGAQPPLDLAIDGADEVDPDLALIKGRGAAHVREKVVAALAARFVVLVDDSKLVDRLGTTMPVPVEALPFAAPAVERALRALGATPMLRMGERKDGPVVSDQGLWILDARFDGIDDAGDLGAAIDAIPGVLGHGLFLNLATDVLVGEADGSVRHIVRP